ncbi:MAG: treY [Solirubrobacterales bacterium]|nr:treY [Solirubrobacterales bacterium]
MNATYRLQLGPHLDLAGARALVPYLRDLGVSRLYLSPVMQARAGSTHGYDVVDPTTVSEDLGGEAALRELAEEGLPILLDWVPNHMAATDDNRFWRDPELRERFFDLDRRTGRHRRFFDIDDLAGVRQEDPEVFAETHRTVLRLVRQGVVDGLRIDHPDGLADPAGYLRRLRQGGARRVWVEKILERGEELRDWPVQGTVGYEFLNDAAGVFVDPAGERDLTDLWVELSGDARPFAEWAAEGKHEQAAGTFAWELERLRSELDRDDLTDAVASLPVYRSYAEPWSGLVEDADRAAVAGLPADLRRILLLEEPGHDSFVTRFQQTTPPVMAKGVEDTAFYRYLRLLALNEVGGDPGRFGLSVEGFHTACAGRAARFPRGLLASQTHDTKRSGDVRARLGALSGMAADWRAAVADWRRLAEPLRARGAPDAVEEYLIFQTLVGAWPLEADRLTGYLEKALREAKRHTNWLDQDRDYEGRVLGFARALYDHEAFRASFDPFAARVAAAGERAALGQLALKLTSPGVPDIYQGDELTSLALVDPDNRRPVDWDARRAALADVRGGSGPLTGDVLKLATIVRLLELRGRRPDPFAGAYAPVDAGPDCVAYLRGAAEVLVVVPLRGGRWSLELPREAAGVWRDVLTGVQRRLGAGASGVEGLLEDPWPFAVLERA